MEKDTSACTFPERERMLLAYLNGSISETEAEAFETHCMTCDECSAELERGIEIRAAQPGRPAAASSGAITDHTEDRGQLHWRWLAAAASVVLVVSLWQLNHFSPAETPTMTPSTPTASTPPSAPVVSTPPTVSQTPRTPAVTPRISPVLRSPSGSGLKPEAARQANGDVRLTWTAVGQAARYRTKVNAADGTLVFSTETTATELTIAASQLSQQRGARLVATVEAMTPLGVTLATSAPIQLPTRK